MVNGHAPSEAGYSLKSLTVRCGTGGPSEAMVELGDEKGIYQATASGNGPVDATYRAIDQIVGKEVTLEEYLVQAMTGGSDDIGKVHIQVSRDGAVSYGFGSDTDIVTEPPKPTSKQ